MGAVPEAVIYLMIGAVLFSFTASLLQILLVVVVLGAAFGYGLFLLWKRSLMKSTNFQWQEMVLRTAHGGYYVWDADRETETFSVNLVNIFRLREDQQNFKEFARFFEQEKEVFERAFRDLASGARRRFSFNVRANICGRTHHFLCSGYRVENRDYKFEGVILWLFDVTDYILKMKELTEESDRIRLERRNLQNVLSALPFPVWQRDDAFNVRYCNPAYTARTDGSVESSERAPEMLPDLSADVRSALKSGKEFRREHFSVADGERALLLVREIPDLRSGGSVGFATDIGELQELRRRIEAHVTAYADLLESSSSGMAVYAKDARLIKWNQSFARQFGLSHEYLESEPLFQEVLETLRASRQLPEQKDFAAFRRDQIALFNKNMKEPQNDFYHLPDGRYLRVIVIPHALGGLLFVYEDLTDNLRIRSSYNRLVAVQKATLDYLKEGIMLVGADGRVTLFNPRFAGICPGAEGFLASSPHIRDVLERMRGLYHPAQDQEPEAVTVTWEEVREEFVANAMGREHRSCACELEGKIYNVSFIPLPDGQTLVSFLEVTAAAMVERTLRERNGALEQADKLKNDFLAGISYDLRTPLTAIIGFSQVLNDEYFGSLNGSQREYTMDIFNAANQLLAMINNIIDMAGMRAGKFELRYGDKGAAALMQSALRLVEGLAKEKGVELHLDDAAVRRVILYCDEARLTQMFFYLLHKTVIACSAARAGAVFSASVRPDGAVRFSVSCRLKEGEALPVTLRSLFDDIRNVAFSYSSSSSGLVSAADVQRRPKRAEGGAAAELSSAFVRDIAERHHGRILTFDERRDDAEIFACVIPADAEQAERERTRIA